MHIGSSVSSATTEIENSRSPTTMPSQSQIMIFKTNPQLRNVVQSIDSSSNTDLISYTSSSSNITSSSDTIVN